MAVSDTGCSSSVGSIRYSECRYCTMAGHHSTGSGGSKLEKMVVQTIQICLDNLDRFH